MNKRNQFDLKEHYDHLYRDAIQKIRNGHDEPDPMIDSPVDHRYGLTLLLRPGVEVRQEIGHFLKQLHHLEPDQYFYPDSDLHVTLLSVISCFDGFALSQILLDEYIQIIQKSLAGASRFAIEFRGLTASPSCLMIQGFPQCDALNKIRTRLRSGFMASGLPHSMDQRYTLQTAHSTIVRLKEKLKHREELLRFVESYREHLFGTFRVEEVELVCNDWYHRQKTLQSLARFEL